MAAPREWLRLTQNHQNQGDVVLGLRRIAIIRISIGALARLQCALGLKKIPIEVNNTFQIRVLLRKVSVPRQELAWLASDESNQQRRIYQIFCPIN